MEHFRKLQEQYDENVLDLTRNVQIQHLSQRENQDYQNLLEKQCAEIALLKDQIET